MPPVQEQESGGTYFAPGRIEDDIQAIIADSAERQTDIDVDLSLLNWGTRIMFGQGGTDHVPSVWREMLQKGQQRLLDSREAEGYTSGGPAFIAAVCVRDHLAEMEEADRRWCVDVLIKEIERDCDTNDSLIYGARSASLIPDRAAAYVLPKVMIDESTGHINQAVLKAVAMALTHSVREVAHYAADGVGFYSQGAWDDLAYQFRASLAKGAMIHAELVREQRSKQYHEWRDWHSVEREAAGEARRLAIGQGLDANAEFEKLDLNETEGQLVARQILQVLGHNTTGAISKRFHYLIAESLARIWNADEEDHLSSRNRDFENEYACKDQLSRFVLKLASADALHICAPLIGCVITHPKEAGEFVDSLTYQGNDLTHSLTYWSLWQAFADKCIDAPWTEHLSSRYPMGLELIKALFLNISWTAEATHWPFLNNNSYRLDNLLNVLPAATLVLAAYTRFLFNIGEKSLPSAFVTVGHCLKRGTANCTDGVRAFSYCS